MDEHEAMVVDFSQPDSLGLWQTVNDGVMGGLSESGLESSGEGSAVFQGIVSLENDGGFASVRTQPEDFNLAGWDGFLLQVKGDGRTYRVRVHMDARFEGIAYQAKFDTREDEWIEARVSFAEFVPTFRGRTLKDAPPLDASKVQRMGIMIADKQEGPFRLEIRWVKAYSKSGREMPERRDGPED
jgi:hypothetical protein